MKSIKSKILIRFCLLAIVSIAMVGMMVSWKLDGSIALQSELLTTELTTQFYKILDPAHQLFALRLHNNIRRIADVLGQYSGILQALKSNRFLTLTAKIRIFAEKETLDFAMLFNLNGQLLSSFPHELNDQQIEQYFLTSEPGKRSLDFLRTASPDQENIWDTIAPLDAVVLKQFGLADGNDDGQGTLGIVAATILFDDFGDPVGIGFVGSLLRNQQGVLEELHQSGGYASVLYYQQVPLTFTGFETLAENEVSAEAFQLDPAIIKRVASSHGNVHGRLSVGDTPYLSACSALQTMSGEKVGLFCTGLPETAVREIQQRVALSGNQTKRVIEIWIVGIGLLSVMIFALISLRLATTIVSPIKHLLNVANLVAIGDFQHDAQVCSGDELEELGQSLQQVIDTFREATSAYEAIAQGDLTSVMSLRSDQDMLGKAYQKMSVYLTSMADTATQIAKGNLSQSIHPKTEKDVLGLAFQAMLHYLQHVADLAEKISLGDVRMSIEPKSDQDVLSTALEQMLVYLQDVAQVTERISHDDLQLEILPRSEHDVLNLSLQQMIRTLRTVRQEVARTIAEIEEQNWLKTGQAELNDTMRGEQETSLLARRIITYLATYLQAQVGALYLKNDDNELRLSGSFAYTTRKGNRNVFQIGEALVGQAALEKRSILFTNVPDDYMHIASGLGETCPRHILVVPLIYEGTLKGVVELGTIDAFQPTQRTFLEEMTANIAIALHSAQIREQLQELLSQTQQQAQELQEQQEQLRVTNEELEEQTQILRASEQKLQEQQEELRQTNEELEEQTRLLEQQQQDLQENNHKLENARCEIEEKARQLEISTKYKSEFLSNMSHELRTPLNSLLILSQLLTENREENLSEKQLKFLHTIQSSGQELLELINEVLDLSKVEAGKMIVNIEEMSLNGLNAYIQQHFAHVADERHLYLRVTIEEGMPARMTTDRQRVEQIVKNFLSNALKFTTQGGITVHIGRPGPETVLAQQSLVASHTVGISVIDTGIGIPEEKQHLIFEAFQQADGSTSRKYGGTGLGLSISRELAKLLGGEIQLQSQEGSGTTFTLFLPERLVQPEQPALPEAANTEVAALKPQAGDIRSVEPTSACVTGELAALRDDRLDIQPGEKTLLIIEDDPKFAKVLFDLARQRGFQALIAGDGEAGLQLAFQYLPSAMILDVGLPGIDGWTVMEKLKKHSATRHIPVHFISAVSEPVKAMKMGAVGYLTKPVRLEKLYDAFNSLERILGSPPKKILIVTANKDIQQQLLTFFSNLEIIGVPCQPERDLYRQLQVEPVDGLFFDMSQDNSKIWGQIKRIKDDEVFSNLPMIFYTESLLRESDVGELDIYFDSLIIEGQEALDRLQDQVLLFLHHVESSLPAQQQRQVTMFHDKEAALEGKTVLLVDDDMRNVFALSSVLEENGLNAFIAENGREALDALAEQQEIDLVLMDIMMPEMDGYEAMALIRKDPQLKDLPIIALTAKAMKGDRQKCLDAGANDYLAKPVDVDKLLSLLRVWLY